MWLLFATELGTNTAEINALVSTLELSKLDSWHAEMLISSYPPLATFFFWMLIHNPLPFPIASSWVSILFLAYIVTILWMTAFLRGRGTTLLSPILLVAAVLLHPRLVLARFDALVTLLLFLTIFSFDAKQFRRGGFFLGSAIALKFVPIVLLPIVFAIFPQKWRQMAEGLLLSVIFNFSLISLIAGPWAYIENWLSFLRYHGGVGVDALSNISALHMLGVKIAGMRVDTGVIANDNLTIWNLDLPHSVRVVTIIIILMGIGWMTFRLWRKGEKEKPSLFPVFSAALMWFLLIAPHFSPQYLVWVLPLILYWLCETWGNSRFSKEAISIGIGIFAVGYLTQWIYPLHWTNLYAAQNLPIVIIHVLRAFAMACTVLLLWKSAMTFNRPTPSS